jgi:signal transduction histidine kinase
MPASRSLKQVLLTHELALFLLVVLTGLLASVSAHYWQETSRQSLRITRMTNAAQEIRTHLFRQVKEVSWARLLQDADSAGVYTRFSREIDRHFNILRQSTESHDEDLAVQALQKSYRRLQVDMNKIFVDTYPAAQVAPIRLLDPAYERTLVAGFETDYDQLATLLGRTTRALVERERLWTRLAMWGISVPMALAVLLLALMRHRIQGGFVRPVAALTAGARCMSAGNLDVRVPEEGVTELAELAKGFNHMAQELKRSREALVESERAAALGALVPVVAHNIRNPLASIRATAQLLDDDTDAEEKLEIRQLLIETVDRLGRWVSSLVSYLHPLKPAPVLASPTTLLDAAGVLLAPRLEVREVRLLRGDWNADVRVAIDVDLMEQALYGLMSNAVDASPQGGTLELSCRVEGDCLRIGIRDHGPGMPFRPEPGGLEPGPTTKRMGTGLGIPVAFKVCKAHGWSIAFEAAPGGGTEVVIRAPLSAPACSIEPEEHEAA